MEVNNKSYPLCIFTVGKIFPILLSSLLLLLVCPYSSLGETTRVDCPLKWKSEGYGSVPLRPVPCALNSEDFIGRVFNSGKWIPARIVPSKGKAFITQNGAVLAFDIYEVLTSPNYCILEWIDDYGGDIPEHGTPVDTTPSSPKQYFIGSGVIAGATVCGAIDILQSSILLAYQGKEELRRHYKVLTSTYPPLEIELDGFKFDTSGINNNNNRTELVGQEEMQVHPNEMKPIVNFKIHHSKQITEKFILTEDAFEWKGISRLSLSFPLWYGTSDVSVKEQEIDELEPEVVFLRDRLIQVDTEFQAEGSPTVTGNLKIRHFQVCSVVNIIEGVDVPFEAEVTYKAEGLKSEQIEDILNKLGRPLIKPLRSGRSVKGIMSGILKGKFALHTSWYSTNPNSPKLCSEYYK